MLSSFRNVVRRNGNVVRRNGKLLCSLNDVNRLTTIKTSLTLHDRQLYHKVAVRMMSSNESKNENDENDKNDNNTNADNNNGDANNNSSEQELISKLQKEVKDLKDQVIRSYAEEENVRRIAKRDVENAKSYANEKMAKAMLDVADNLDRALAAIPIEERTSSSSDSSENNTLSTFIEGITMTEKNLQKIFVQFNIIKYGQIGDAFNPSLHDALFQIPDPLKEPNTIGQVLKSGYKLKDRVIRAAQVGTVVKPQ